jgi:hypothetical protein
MPALPLDEAGKYVAAAYIVFCALILIYVAIMAAKLQRIERELGELADLAEERQRHPARNPAAPGRGSSMEMSPAQAGGRVSGAGAEEAAGSGS